MPNIVEVVIKASNQSKAAMTEAAASGEGLSSKLTKVGAVGGLALAAIAVASVKMATDFQSSTTRLVTSANESNKNIGMVRQGMLDMAGQVGMSADSLAKGMYTVESAGYHGAAGLVVLKAAAQGAKDENADLGTVANAVTDVLVDYHMKASDAADVTSKLVKAVSFGKTNFQDFSQSMSVILPLASAMHLKLSDVAGVEAEMTSHGISAQEASQQMANAMRHLEAPTNVMIKNFGAFGISADQVHQHLATQGLGGTLEWLRGVADKMAPSLGMTVPQALAKLMGSANGLQVALATTGENAKGTQAAIAGISGASKDAQGNVAGFSEVQKSFKQQLSEVEAQAGSLAIEFGNKLMPMLQSVLGWISHNQGTVKDLAKAIAAVMGALAAYAIVAKTVAIAQAALNLVMDMNPFVAIGLAVVVLAAIIIKYHTQIWNFIKTTWTTIVDWLKNLWDGFLNFAKQWWPLIFGTAGLIYKYHEQIWAFIKLIWNTIFNFLKGLWHDIESAANAFGAQQVAGFKNTWNSVYSTARSVWNTVSNFLHGVWNGIHSIASSFWSTEENGFRNAWNSVFNTTRSIWNSIIGWFRGVPGGIEGTLHGVGSWMVGWAKGVMNGMLQGFRSVWNAVTGFFKSLAKDILNALGIHSPPQWAIDAGVHIMNGLGIGMNKAKAVVHSTAGKIAAAAASAISGAGVSNSSAFAALKSAAAKAGWTGGQWSALNNVEMREAGYNIHAQNPSSGAYGMAQFINGPSEYAQYGGNSTTAAGQAVAMVNYIRQRYGNPVNAWAHEVSAGWYQKGGPTTSPWAVVGERGRELVKLPVGSQVFNNSQTNSALGSGKQELRITLELGESFRKAGLTQDQLEDIRYTIRTIGGGNVQTALGKN
jgi:TP901 family phage tail tape measure protein